MNYLPKLTRCVYYENVSFSITGKRKGVTGERKEEESPSGKKAEGREKEGRRKGGVGALGFCPARAIGPELSLHPRRLTGGMFMGNLNIQKEHDLPACLLLPRDCSGYKQHVY